MPMLTAPSQKYDSYKPVDLPDRQWPGRVQRQAPAWLSTDLRDGNQALEVPMAVEQKLLLFENLVACGFKEIEVGFPSASETEYEFVRLLVECNLIPDDVWIQVMTPCRKEFIEKTFEATQGAKKVIVQLYNSPAQLFREVIYHYTGEEVIKLATTHTRIVRKLADEYHAKEGTAFRLCYGVEGFTQTDLTYAIDICNRVKMAWEEPGKSYPVIMNLAGTVENGPSNHFADQIEYFCRNFPNRDEIIVCVHTHNDRGTAVAATELAMLAGAERVDVCLTGNGERSGNVDGIVLALNLYSQGINPGLDFSNLSKLVDVVTSCNKLPVHPRHPYIGRLVYTAFSGGHQDGIAKGFRAMEERHSKLAPDDRKVWSVPYLPVDPTDFGFAYEAVRVNSQSGKSGVAYVIKQTLGLDLPKPVQADFHRIVQEMCDTENRKMSSNDIAGIFRETYRLDEISRICNVTKIDGSKHWDVSLNIGDLKIIAQRKNGCDILASIIDEVAGKLPVNVAVSDKYLSDLQDAQVASFIKLSQGTHSSWGVGISSSSVEAELRALACALVRLRSNGYRKDVSDHKAGCEHHN